MPACSSASGQLVTTTRTAVGFVAGCAGAMATYAVLRGWQAIAIGEANPATVFARLHLAYFWRAMTSLYAGGMAAGIAALGAPRDPTRLARAARIAGAGLVAAAFLLVAQAIAFP
jgi:hypothetical protein